MRCNKNKTGLQPVSKPMEPLGCQNLRREGAKKCAKSAKAALKDRE